jgi:hypothetical protein
MTRSGRQMTTATFAVLDKTFADPDLPESWRARRDEAYSRAHLRAAAQAYTTREFALAKECMTEAVRLDPALCADDAEPLARLTTGWANLPKTSDPLGFLVSVYEHLPENLDVLRRRRRRDLSRQGLQLALTAFENGQMKVARRRLWQAVGYQPSVLFTSGAISTLMKSLLPFRLAAGQEGSRVRQDS